jgi:hypothetical protein
MNRPQVLSSEEIQYNWKSWNSLQNTYNLHVIDRNAKFPQYLLIRAWEWFCEAAKEYHVDVSYYKYVTITKWDCNWQVEFHDQEDEKGSHFSLYEIYYDSKNKKILQACFGI